MHKKNIVILTGVDPNKRSGKTVADLKNLFKKNGHSVVIITNVYLREQLPDVISVRSLYEDYKDRILSRIKSMFRIKRNPDYYMSSEPSHKRRFNVNLIHRKLPFEPDAFIYLFPHNFLNEEALYHLNIKTGAPIFQYMVDMAELTGGCHYAWDCGGYIKSCGKCPGLYSNNAKDETYYNLQFKQKFLGKTEIYPIAASQWQMEQLNRSTLFKDSTKYKILLPVDENTFRKYDRQEARAKLGLPLDKQLIFFGAVNTTERRKGPLELLKALKYLFNVLPAERRDNVHLVIAGTVDIEFMQELKFGFTTLGYLNYQNLGMAYSACNVFACPSIEDSGPSMINQSLMCGTPVVSFTMGVALDLVANFKTGYSAILYDTNDFANGMKYILDLNDSEESNIRSNCYLKAKNSCSNDVFYSRFAEILNKNKPSICM